MSRIYYTQGEITNHLVRAHSQAQADRFVMRGKIKSRVATQQDIIDGLQAGMEIEDATAATEAANDEPDGAPEAA